MRDDGNALIYIGTEAAGVIEMMMRIDQVADRFVRNQLVHFRYDSKRSLLVQRPFDNNYVIRKLDRHTMMSAAS